MVEHVEDFPAELNQLAFCDLRTLNHREISVVESRTDHDVAAETAEASDRHDERRDIKPAIRRAEDRDWTSHVRSHSVVDTRERRVVNHDVHRIATLRLHDRAELPALNKLIAVERRLVNAAEHDAMTRIEV